jgi:hypothetical protein
VGFRDDCEGIVIVTPDDLFLLEPKDDELEETDDEPLDEPLEEPDDPEDDYPDLDVDPDHIRVDPDPLDPTYPGEWDYDPDDDEPLQNISYVPYTVVTVTFRVMSVPS